MSLIWGARTIICDNGKTVNELMSLGDKKLIEQTFLKKHDKVVVVAGTGLSSGATNMLKIHTLGDHD